MKKCEICNNNFKHLGAHLNYKHNMSTKEYYDKYLKKENEGICSICGKKTAFLGLSKGYRDTCSSSCGSKKGSIKSKQTKKEKYGDENYNNREKAKETCMKKYGVDNPGKSKECQEKAQQTRIDNCTTQKEIRTKVEDSFIEKYGTLKNAYLEINKKGIATRKNKNKEFRNKNDLIPVIEINKQYGVGWYNNAKNLNITFIKYNNTNYVKVEDIEKIKEYFNEKHAYCGYSMLEKQIKKYIESIYSGTIIENTRKIISPQELDIYIPDKNLAIEFNGTYWHSTIAGISKTYHLEKSKLCEEKGIRLIHIYEWELEEPYWTKVKMMLNQALGSNPTIYARNCKIKEISNREAKVLNEEVHLQGHRNAQITYGLFYEDELVQLMSFSKTKYNKNLKGENDWEIIRGCPGSNISVVGGVSKLFKHFIREHNPDKVFSYCDFNKFDGKSYEALGMQFIGYTGPDKTWIIDGEPVKRNPKRYKELKEQAEGVMWGSGSKKYEWRFID